MAIYQGGDQSLSALFGQALGTGLSSGLQQLAQSRLSQLQQRQQQTQQATGLQALGFTPQESSQLSLLPPDIVSQVVKQRLQAPQQAAYSQALSSLFGVQQPQVMPATQGVQEAQAMQQPGAQPSITAPAGLPVGLSEQQATRLAQLGLQKGEQELRQKKATLAEEKAGYELFQPIRQAALEDRQNAANIETARELVKRGDFSSPLLVSFADKMPGGFLDALKSRDTKMLEAIRPLFMQNMKKLFGPQISDADVREMYKSIISPTSTKDQNMAILDVMENAVGSSTLKDKILDEVIDKYSNKSPFQQMKIVDKQYAQKLENLLKEKRKRLGQKRTEGALLESLPKDARVGQKFMNDATGEIVQWTGSKWERAS